MPLSAPDTIVRKTYTMENITFEKLPEAVSQLIGKVNHLEQLLSSQKPEPIDSPDLLLTVEQAAEYLKLTTPTIYSKVSRRELPVMTRGKRLYFSQNELLEYLQQGRKKTVSDISQEAEGFISGKH